MNNRVYEAALSLVLGKVEQGEGKIQAIEDILWVLRYLIDDKNPFCASKDIQEMRTKLREAII